MRLDGIYTGPDITVPDGIRATGTPEEFARVYDRVGLLPARAGTFRAGEQSMELDPDKGVVRRIAKATEVVCSDQRLIDWMAQA